MRIGKSVRFKIVKFVIVTLLVSSTNTAGAVEMEVVGPCEMEPQLKMQVELKENEVSH